jgi:hypothetical protein
MFGSSIIDIAIGLIFVYLLLSLICSAANETIERFSKMRAKDLERGLGEMLRDDDLVERLYKHPLIYSLFPKPYAKGGFNLPSYIPARSFALALMDVVCPAEAGDLSGATGSTGPGFAASTGDALTDIKAHLPKLRATLMANTTIPDDVKRALVTCIDAGSDDPSKVRQNIEGWFDSAMDRVSGGYKRRSQLIVLCIGLVLTILLNVDTLTIVRTLSTDKAMRDSLVVAAQEYAKNNPAPTPVVAASPVVGNAPASKPSPAAKPSAMTTSSPVGRRPPAAAVSNASASPAVTATPSGTPPANASSGATTQPSTPEQRIQQNLNAIKALGLPIGWTRTEGDPRSVYISPQAWFLRIIGWLVTALALSLGAPFWFDMLNKFIVVRSTVKPKEKSPDEKSKD